VKARLLLFPATAAAQQGGGEARIDRDEEVRRWLGSLSRPSDEEG
jgi:hypothetical protein